MDYQNKNGYFPKIMNRKQSDRLKRVNSRASHRSKDLPTIGRKADSGAPPDLNVCNIRLNDNKVDHPKSNYGYRISDRLRSLTNKIDSLYSYSSQIESQLNNYSKSKTNLTRNPTTNIKANKRLEQLSNQINNCRKQNTGNPNPDYVNTNVQPAELKNIANISYKLVGLVNLSNTCYM